MPTITLNGTKFVVETAAKSSFTNKSNFTSHQIYSTKDYENFYILEGNRDIKAGHVERLVKAIEKQNLLSANPMIVNENGDVIDGQHRLAAAEQLGIPVFFIVVPGLTVETVATLNSNKSNWSTADYLASHKDGSNPEPYLFVEELAAKFNLSIPQALSLLGYQNRDIGSNFKQGLLSNATEDAKKVANVAGALITQLLEQGVAKPEVTNRKFVTALVNVVKSNEFDAAMMSIKLKKHAGKIQPCTKVEEYQKILINIYNYKNTARRIV